MNIMQAVILGVVEGATEFLPVSSTAHLIVVERLFGIVSASLFFDTVVQLGALLALILYFHRQILVLLQDKKTALYLGIATLPVLLIGFLLRKHIALWHQSLPLIAVMSIGIGLLLWVAERFARKAKDFPPGTKHWLVMGIFQVLALIPGTSRSGIVVAGGLFAGLNFSRALENSFLLSIPALGSAGAYELLSSFKTPPDSQTLLMTGIATLVSCLVALGAIHFLLTTVKKIGFTPFVIYRIIFGVAILWLMR